ncbi:MAG: amidohydrolase family protein, partial [Clostridia bacterium]|nr:amidohydrolase family protein [Clostridia bacterium]
MQIALCDAIPEYKGLRMTEVAKLHGKEEYETLFDILVANNLGGTACYFTMCDADICTVLRWPRAMIGTDGGSVRGGTMCHPRTIGTFPRVLGRYVREKGVTSLPEMIRKMTAMPAAVYGLKSKGLVWEGMDADLCIFDPDKIIDRSTFTDCIQKAEGLNYVLVGGEVVVKDAVANGKRK